MLKSAPESLLTVLSNVQPYFEENIIRDFKDFNERRTRRPPSFLDIPNVLTVHESESRLMKNIKLMKQPNFKIQSVELCMKQLYLKVSLEIEQVLVEAQYEMFNNESKPTEKYNETGNLIFDIENLQINSIIPIYVQEDSFMANENFSMSLKPSKITTRKSSNIDGKVESSESVDTDIEKSLINSIWSGFSETISFLIRQDLGASIVEYSVTELFADEPEEMIEFSNKRIAVASKVMNAILQKAVVPTEAMVIKLPELNLSYKSTSTLKITMVCLQDPELLNLGSIQPLGTYCITEENERAISVSGGINIRNLTINFTNCWASCDGIVTTGNCKYVVYRTKLLLKILFEKKDKKLCAKLDKVQLCWIRDTECDFNDLLSVNDIQDELTSYIEAFLLGELQPLITSYLKEHFEGILKKYKVNEDIKDIV
ncbi:uncharacterized protein [Onthophagus taurus]|uniref:uncharacterized protein n=1 Tax=Onthophagus taurus TaxID=166361 RepID=UPI0039BE0C79